MPQTSLPFRADIVGSLLRPAELKQARAAFAAGRIDGEALRAVEDRLIRQAVARQQAIGLKAATDGEFRRAWWHFDFLAGLDGVELLNDERGVETIRVAGRLGFPENHRMIEDFRFLAGIARAMPKMTIPSPSVLHFRVDRAEAYRDVDGFVADLGRVYGEAIAAFHAAGCRYLQLDDTVWGYLCSERERDAARRRGEEPDRLPDLYAAAINRALEAKPAGMTVTMHVCRGNYRSSWIAEGSYEPVAKALLGGIDVDGYFLEYDTDRAGGFEPLRLLPEGGKRVVLGLVTTKSGALEDADTIRRRIEDAARFVPLERLCLSPQCGFASSQEGNLLTEDEQWRKLELVVRIAEDVWGDG